MTQENVNYPTTLPPAFRKLVIRSVVLPLALALLIGSVFVWQVARLLAVDAAVHHSDLVIGQAIEVEKMLVDMETGLRAYVITNQWQFMQPYTDASGKIDAGIANLRNLVALNLDQEQRVEILSRQANAWRSYAVDLKSQVGRGTEAQSVIATGRGKALMDSVRQEVSEIVDVETQLRDTQSSSAPHGDRSRRRKHRVVHLLRFRSGLCGAAAAFRGGGDVYGSARSRRAERAGKIAASGQRALGEIFGGTCQPDEG